MKDYFLTKKLRNRMLDMGSGLGFSGLFYDINTSVRDYLGNPTDWPHIKKKGLEHCIGKKIDDVFSVNKRQVNKNLKISNRLLKTVYSRVWDYLKSSKEDITLDFVYETLVKTYGSAYTTLKYVLKNLEYYVSEIKPRFRTKFFPKRVKLFKKFRSDISKKVPNTFYNSCFYTDLKNNIKRVENSLRRTGFVPNTELEPEEPVL